MNSSSNSAADFVRGAAAIPGRTMRAGIRTDEAAAVMHDAYGRDITVYDEDFLAKTLTKREAELGIAGSAYSECLARDPREADRLFESLNVVYSEFFRNPLAFAILEQCVLPLLAQEKGGKSELRVWSAGCAAGQEAYSAAILLEALSMSRPGGLQYRIFATDRSAEVLERAARGSYEAAEVANVRKRHLDEFFVRRGPAYSIAPRLRDRVSFSLHDLLDESSPVPSASIYGDFDLVFCGNILFYYGPSVRRRIVERMQRAIVPGGFLVTGGTERAIVKGAGGFVEFLHPASVFRNIAESR
jgi:chemotaxis protein methyltransferase CheR